MAAEQWAIGDKTWAKAFSEKNVSCLTCLSQLKCLHLKQNYSIVNHNELQSLRSLPARHKRKEEDTDSLRKFRVAQRISVATYLLYHWEYLQVLRVQTAVIYSCCLSHYQHTIHLFKARERTYFISGDSSQNISYSGLNVETFFCQSQYFYVFHWFNVLA